MKDVVELLRLAYQTAASGSDDPSTHNGSVLVTTTDYLLCGSNHFPGGVEKKADRLERPKKYAYMEHAERDVILEAARRGVITDGATLYVPWYACADCARAIIGAGISRVVGHKQMFLKTPERWRASISDGDAMLDEAGVIREQYDGPIGGVQVLFDGEWWTP
jgi:deoxycytidylate deaminase